MEKGGRNRWIDYATCIFRGIRGSPQRREVGLRAINQVARAHAQNLGIEACLLGALLGVWGARDREPDQNSNTTLDKQLGRRGASDSLCKKGVTPRRRCALRHGSWNIGASLFSGKFTHSNLASSSFTSGSALQPTMLFLSWSCGMSLTSTSLEVYSMLFTR